MIECMYDVDQCNHCMRIPEGRGLAANKEGRPVRYKKALTCEVLLWGNLGKR